MQCVTCARIARRSTTWRKPRVHRADGAPELVVSVEAHAAESLRERLTRLWSELSALLDEAPETLREVEDDQLAAACRRLERRIHEARR